MNKKLFAGLVVAGALTLGVNAFAAEEAVVEDNKTVIEAVQGEETDAAVETEVTDEAAATEEAETAEDAETAEETAEDATAEEAEATEATEEKTEETTEAVEATEEKAEEAETAEATEEKAEEAAEAVVIDYEVIAKDAVVIGETKVEFAEGLGKLVQKDGVIFVPVRAMLEAAGYQVSWSDKEQMVMGANQENGAMFIMQLDNTLLFYLSAEGQEGKITMEAAPYKNEEEWRTYVPLNAFAEALGYKIGVNAETSSVTLSK